MKPTVWDGLVVLAVAALAAGCLLALGRGAERAAGGLTAVVSVDGREVDRFAPEALLPMKGAGKSVFDLETRFKLEDERAAAGLSTRNKEFFRELTERLKMGRG